MAPIRQACKRSFNAEVPNLNLKVFGAGRQRRNWSRARSASSKASLLAEQPARRLGEERTEKAHHRRRRDQRIQGRPRAELPQADALPGDRTELLAVSRRARVQGGRRSGGLQRGCAHGSALGRSAAADARDNGRLRRDLADRPRCLGPYDARAPAARPGTQGERHEVPRPVRWLVGRHDDHGPAFVEVH